MWKPFDASLCQFYSDPKILYLVAGGIMEQIYAYVSDYGLCCKVNSLKQNPG